MDKLEMGIYLTGILLVVLYLRFGRTKRSTAPHHQTAKESHSNWGQEAEKAETLFSAHSDTNPTENSVLGGIVSPSPSEIERQTSYSRSIFQPLENSLFESDKVDDLTRPLNSDSEGSSMDLFAMNHKHDLLRPYGED